jgi:hypothetical protein
MHVWLVVDQIVTLLESSADEDITKLLSDWVSGLVLNAWLKSVDGWQLLASLSLPLLYKVDNVLFDITFWGKEIISGVAVEVTAETSEGTLMLGGASEVDGFSLVEDDSSAHAGNGESIGGQSLDGEGTDVDWKAGNWFVLDVNGTTGNELDFGLVKLEKETSSANLSRAVVIDHGQADGLVGGFPESVSTLAVEVVVLTVKSLNVTLASSANTITLVLSAVEVSS